MKTFTYEMDYRPKIYGIYSFSYILFQSLKPTVILHVMRLRRKIYSTRKPLLFTITEYYSLNYISFIFQRDITKTRLYNFDPLQPHFYIVKLGFTGVYIIFLISAKNIDYGYSLEPPRRGGSYEYPQSTFWAEIWKILEFLSENSPFIGCKIFSIFE